MFRMKSARVVSSQSWFTRFAKSIAHVTGRPIAFILASLTVVTWAILGPIFGFSDTWQLVINTGTTIVTFLMVFLIQNAQYRDSEAIHIKLDELIRAVENANDALLDLEELDDKELNTLKKKYLDAAMAARRGRENIASTEVQ